MEELERWRRELASRIGVVYDDVLKKPWGELTAQEKRVRYGRPKTVLEKSKVPQRLKDMRRVYETEDGSGDTPGQKKMRALLESNRWKFVQMMDKSELEYFDRVEAKRKVMVEAFGRDAGVERCIGLVETLLKELDYGDGRGSVERGSAAGVGGESEVATGDVDEGGAE